MNNTTTTTRKIGQPIFITLLAINGLIAFALGATTLINFPFALETGFGIPYSAELDVLGLVMGCQLIFLGVMITLSIIWTRQGKTAGTTIGIAVGTYLLAFGLLAFLRLGDTTALYVDCVRGVLTIVAAVFAYREIEQ